MDFSLLLMDGGLRTIGFSLATMENHVRECAKGSPTPVQCLKCPWSVKTMAAGLDAGGGSGVDGGLVAVGEGEHASEEMTLPLNSGEAPGTEKAPPRYAGAPLGNGWEDGYSLAFTTP